MTAAFTPAGAGFNREVHTIAAEVGFCSGWENHEGGSVVLGSGGQTGLLIQ